MNTGPTMIQLGGKDVSISSVDRDGDIEISFEYNGEYVSLWLSEADALELSETLLGTFKEKP